MLMVPTRTPSHPDQNRIWNLIGSDLVSQERPHLRRRLAIRQQLATPLPVRQLPVTRQPTRRRTPTHLSQPLFLEDVVSHSTPTVTVMKIFTSWTQTAAM